MNTLTFSNFSEIDNRDLLEVNGGGVDPLLVGLITFAAVAHTLVTCAVVSFAAGCVYELVLG